MLTSTSSLAKMFSHRKQLKQKPSNTGTLCIDNKALKAIKHISFKFHLDRVGFIANEPHFASWLKTWSWSEVFEIERANVYEPAFLRLFGHVYHSCFEFQGGGIFKEVAK